MTVDEPSEEEAPVLTSDESVEPDKDTPLETLPSEEGAEEAEQSSEEPADIETDEEEVEAAADEHIEDVTSNEQSSEAIIEEEPAQIEEPQDIPPEENAPAEADQAVSASPARSLSSIKLPPPPTLKSPPPLGNLPGADDVDLDLIFSDDDDLLGDIMRPGLTATAQPLEIPEKPAVEVQEEALKALEDDTSSEPEQEQPEPGSSVDDIDVLMDDLPLSPEEESEALDLFDIVAPAREDAPPVDYKDDIDAGRAPDSFSSGALTKPTPPRQLAQTEGGLQVLAYDDSSAFDTSLEALSVADDAEDIDLMFDGIFGGGGESEDDIFGDMFTTQSLEAVSSPQNPILDDEIATPVDVEDEEPSKELSSLLDNLESDEEEELDIGGLDLQGPSFAEEDQPSAEEEEESLAALLESARQDIDKIQQHKQEEEVQDGDAGDALLANLLGDDALEAPPEEEVAGALPVPEPKKKEKRGLFSKLFGKDD